jgi:hypothetical protein
MLRILLALCAMAAAQPPPTSHLNRPGTIEHPSARSAPVPDQEATPRARPGIAAVPELEDRNVQVRMDELVVVDRVDPAFPVGVRNLNHHECIVRLFVDEEGEPQAVEPLACDPRFVDAARDALMRWRFEPWTDEDGDRRPVKTDLAIEFERPR